MAKKQKSPEEEEEKKKKKISNLWKIKNFEKFGILKMSEKFRNF